MKSKIIKTAVVALSALMIAMQPSFVLAANDDSEAPRVEARLTTIPKGHVYIPKGTVIEVEASKTFSTKEIQVEDVLPIVTSKNIMINEVVVIPKGTKVRAIATRVRKSWMLGRGGIFNFSIVSVKALNGITIPLEYTYDKEKSGNVLISEGTHFEAVVTVDTDLETTVENLANAMKENKDDNLRIMIK